MSVTSRSVRIVKQVSRFTFVMGLIGFSVVFASWNLFGSGRINDITKSVYGIGTSAAPEQRRTLMESEIITATQRGFEPNVISRSEGKFILMVDNRSGGNLNFRLSRENGESLQEFASSREELDWNDLLDLQPGRYVLTERDHSDWTCQITITAR